MFKVTVPSKLLVNKLAFPPDIDTEEVINVPDPE